MDAFEEELPVARCRLPSVGSFQWWEEGDPDTLEVRCEGDVLRGGGGGGGGEGVKGRHFNGDEVYKFWWGVCIIEVLCVTSQT